MALASDDTPLDLACRGDATVDLSDVFVHEYHCEHCEQTSLVDTKCEGVPDPCVGCGALRRRVSDEPMCLEDLL